MLYHLFYLDDGGEEGYVVVILETGVGVLCWGERRLAMKGWQGSWGELWFRVA